MAATPEKLDLDNSQHGDYFRAKLPGGLLVMLFVLFLVWGLTTLAQPGTLPIKHVRIVGDFTRLSPVDLKSRVTDKVYGGFFNLNVDALRLALLEEPWVNRVTVKRVWPDALKVTVIEQIPVVRWREQGLLNADGEYFEPDFNTLPQTLPLLSGPNGTESILLERFRAMQQQVNSIGYDISTLVLNDRRAWTFTLSNGPKIVLGKRDVERRFNRFLLLLPTALSGRIDQADAIDMRYTNGFSIRWKNYKLEEALNTSVQDYTSPGFINATSRYRYAHKSNDYEASILTTPPGVASCPDSVRVFLNNFTSDYRRLRHG